MLNLSYVASPSHSTLFLLHLHPLTCSFLLLLLYLYKPYSSFHLILSVCIQTNSHSRDNPTLDTQKELWKTVFLFSGFASLFLFLTFFGNDGEEVKRVPVKTTSHKKTTTPISLRTTPTASKGISPKVDGDSRPPSPFVGSALLAEVITLSFSLPHFYLFPPSLVLISCRVVTFSPFFIPN